MTHVCIECNQPILKDPRAKRLCSTRFHMGCRQKYMAKLKPVKCACGQCDEQVMPMDENGLSHKYVVGHFSKTRKTFVNNGRFNGYRCKNHNGYWLIRDLNHPFKDSRGYVFEHRSIWEKYHNAMLLSWGIVHHNNHVRVDNKIENLTGMMKTEHDRLESYNRVRDSSGRFK